MNQGEIIVNGILKDFPELLSCDDLVELGIFTHANAAYHARYNGSGPSFIKLKGRIVYPKECVKQYLLSGFKEGAKQHREGTAGFRHAVLAG
jgi:hypothetical protein